jgi:hypothetical protein
MTSNLSLNQVSELLDTLKTRFGNNPSPHQDIIWGQVLSRLETSKSKLWSLYEMERTGGEPNFVNTDPKTEEYLFMDCSAESPKGRRSLCYDGQALDARKIAKPVGSALDMAKSMGVELLSEDQYRFLQTLGQFDLKTSSWILTPQSIRSLGGALFADRRYNSVFVYHNGADSYYAARGFRGLLRV